MNCKNCIHYLKCKIADTKDAENCDSYEDIVNEEEFHRCEDYK